MTTHRRTSRPRKSAKHTRALQSRVIVGEIVKITECRRGRLHIRLSPRKVESSQTPASIVNIERLAIYDGVLLVGPRVSCCSMWTGAGCVRSGEHGLGSDSYALESRCRWVTGRAQWEDPELEVVEDVLQVATTLHDMDRGESVRNSLGGDSGTAARTHAQCSRRPTPSPNL